MLIKRDLLFESLIEWAQNWEQQGRQEGRQQGKQEGRQEAHSGFLKRLLEKKFGPLGAEDEAQLSKADSSQLLEWGERVLTAKRIEDVFRV